jgi:dihydrofolate synthase/folylpolyglutamate synthase
MAELATALGRLYALIPVGQKLGLERMQAACQRFGNPERSFEVVHVAGTNGKGTTCAFTASMARAAGRRVGLYTSPHLVRFAERIQVDGLQLDDATLARLLTEVMDAAPELTYFEVATLTAFLAFREARIDLAVLEVGLGGRLDATNVVPPPRVAAITRIAYDHMSDLGDTLGKIAAEKAAIIKAGDLAVTGASGRGGAPNQARGAARGVPRRRSGPRPPDPATVCAAGGDGRGVDQATPPGTLVVV